MRYEDFISNVEAEKGIESREEARQVLRPGPGEAA
jgi:uncharacterized protein (DUF2267 family)